MPYLKGIFRWTILLASTCLWGFALTRAMEFNPSTRHLAREITAWSLRVFIQLKALVSLPLLEFGGRDITLSWFFKFFVLLTLIFLVGHSVKRVLLTRILNKTPLDLGIQHAIATFTQYIMVVIGFLVILPKITGIDLTGFTIFASAVGVGVGFGLQNITNNLISGVIILLERPIKIGDRIEVGGVNGDVVHMAARSTTVRTNDNIAIIIPNSSFISSNVINWSHGDSKIRFRIPIGVAYNTDVRLVEKLLLEVANENENVLENPPPRVIFKAFGDSALEFELRVWSSRLLHRRGVLISQLNFGILEKFREHKIEIPYPQRDLHLKLEADSLKKLEAVTAQRYDQD